MSQPRTLCDLPTEILHTIARYLDAFSLVWLQRSCRDFRKLIPAPTHQELMEAETTEFGILNGFYACQDCLRLRPRAKFADNMTKRKYAKREPRANNRYCVDCGINPRPHTNRYTAGNHIKILDKSYIICLRCREFGALAPKDWNLSGLCESCGRKFRERIEAERERQRRARLRAEQAARRARRRELYYSASDSDEVVPPSPTWSDEQMDMVQCEADTYMNSPGPGSD